MELRLLHLYTVHVCTHCTHCTCMHVLYVCTHCTCMYALYVYVRTVRVCTLCMYVHCTCMYALYVYVHTVHVHVCTHCTVYFAATVGPQIRGFADRPLRVKSLVHCVPGLDLPVLNRCYVQSDGCSFHWSAHGGSCRWILGGTRRWLAC